MGNEHYCDSTSGRSEDSRPTAEPQPTLRQLFTAFLRLGVTSFGGPTMVAYIRTLAVEKKRWLDAQVFNDGVALCQMIPGATAMQTAAYVGLKTRGVTGAGASFVGFGLPAFLLMMTLAALYTRHRDLPIVLAVFSGLQAVVVAMMANATMSFGNTTIKDWRALIVAGAAATMFGIHVNPILVLLLAALVGSVVMKPQPPISSESTPSETILSHTRPLVLILFVTVSGFLLLFVLDRTRTLFDLALLMFRIDLFAFGGGFAAIPLMLHEVVEVREWIDGPTFMNGIVFGQITPGPIVITATFVGYLLSGVVGGIVATIAIFLPSFVVLVGVSPYFDRLRTWPIFNKVIAGVLCSFVGLLLTATMRFAWDVSWDVPHGLLAVGALVALLLKVDILWVVLVGAVISAVVVA